MNREHEPSSSGNRCVRIMTSALEVGEVFSGPLEQDAERTYACDEVQRRCERGHAEHPFRVRSRASAGASSGIGRPSISC